MWNKYLVHCVVAVYLGWDDGENIYADSLKFDNSDGDRITILKTCQPLLGMIQLNDLFRLPFQQLQLIHLT